jgi:hypothetical protein
MCVLHKALRFGRPATIRCEHGPEISSRHFLARPLGQKTGVGQNRRGAFGWHADANIYVGMVKRQIPPGAVENCFGFPSERYGRGPPIRKSKQQTTVLDNF